MNDFDLYLIRLKLNLTLFLVNCSCELRPAMTSYNDFLEAIELFREMFELNPTFWLNWVK